MKENTKLNYQIMQTYGPFSFVLLKKHQDLKVCWMPSHADAYPNKKEIAP